MSKYCGKNTVFLNIYLLYHNTTLANYFVYISDLFVHTVKKLCYVSSMLLRFDSPKPLYSYTVGYITAMECKKLITEVSL